MADSPLSPSASAEDRAAFAVDGADSSRVLLSGVWTVHTLHQIRGAFFSAVAKAGRQVRLDLSGVTRLDTAGALAVNMAAADLAAQGGAAEILTGDEHFRKLLAKAHLPREEDRKPEKKPPAFLLLLSRTGEIVWAQLWALDQLVGFLGLFLVSLTRIIRRPSRMRWTSLAWHLEQTGLRAVPIVALLTFLIGMVVAYMGSEELAKFGAQVFAVSLLEVTIMREMGVLITAIVVAGRSSSSFTAQIGSMVANEEVAALHSMGLNPADLLVVPRVLSLMIALPMLVFLADIAALLGGAAALWYSMDISVATFWSQYYEAASLQNFLAGMIKTPFFGLAIGIVGCFQGFRASGSAESVGFLTTVSVVQAIFIVILLDALFAIFFTAIGF